MCQEKKKKEKEAALNRIFIYFLRLAPPTAAFVDYDQVIAARRGCVLEPLPQNA